MFHFDAWKEQAVAVGVKKKMKPKHDNNDDGIDASEFVVNVLFFAAFALALFLVIMHGRPLWMEPTYVLRPLHR